MKTRYTIKYSKSLRLNAINHYTEFSTEQKEDFSKTPLYTNSNGIIQSGAGTDLDPVAGRGGEQRQHPGHAHHPPTETQSH